MPITQEKRRINGTIPRAGDLGQDQAQRGRHFQEGWRVTVPLWQCLDCGTVAELGRNGGCQNCYSKSVTTKIYIDPQSRPAPAVSKPDSLIGMTMAFGRPVLCVPASVRLLGFVERAYSFLFGCCVHAWGRPMTLPRRQYPMYYDSHQACVKCGAERYFDFGRMVHGPMFRGKYGRSN